MKCGQVELLITMWERMPSEAFFKDCQLCHLSYFRNVLSRRPQLEGRKGHYIDQMIMGEIFTVFVQFSRKILCAIPTYFYSSISMVSMVVSILKVDDPSISATEILRQPSYLLDAGSLSRIRIISDDSSLAASHIGIINILMQRRQSFERWSY